MTCADFVLPPKRTPRLCPHTRYYGINDPVAAKLLSRYEEKGKLEAPEDT